MRKVNRWIILLAVGLVVAFSLLAVQTSQVQAGNRNKKQDFYTTPVTFMIIDTMSSGTSGKLKCLTNVFVPMLGNCEFDHTTYTTTLPAMRWDLIPAANGSFVIQWSADQISCLEVVDSQANSSLGVKPCNWASAQLWTLELSGYDVNLRSKLTGTYLNFAKNGVITYAVHTVEPHYNLRLMPVGTNLHIVSWWGSKCLDVDNATGGLANGTKVQIWQCDTQANQLYALELMSNRPVFTERGFSYRLLPKHAISYPKTIAIDGGYANGSKVRLWEYSDPYEKNALWFLNVSRVENGRIGFEISNYYSNCMDVDNAGGVINNGDRVQQWDCLGGGQTNQVWYMRGVSP